MGIKDLTDLTAPSTTGVGAACATAFAAAGLNPYAFLDVSLTKLGCPKYRSRTRKPMRAPSLAPYTPTASAVTPPTSATPLFSSANSELNPFPTKLVNSLSSAIALPVSASTFATICRRITSSFARFSAIRPSASEMDLERINSRSCSAFRRSVSRRDCCIDSSVCRLCVSCLRLASSCMFTISAFRWRVCSCSDPYRFRASSSSYCFICACCCDLCWSVCRCCSPRSVSTRT
mmetsp:Transcript_13624/g.50967  ORF Transcript_13624/g.50967 Transcript_13624/m.50967 type:complete len:233 (+) Transcript_13624:997-1695(+)